MTLEPGALLGPYRIVSPLGAGGGVSPDGSRVVIAGREMVSSLVLLDGVAGLGPSK